MEVKSIKNLTNSDIEKKVEEVNLKLTKYKNIIVLNGGYATAIYLIGLFTLAFLIDSKDETLKDALNIITITLSIFVSILSLYSVRKKEKIIKSINKEFRQEFIQNLYADTIYKQNNVDSLSDSCILYDFTHFFYGGCLQFNNEDLDIKMDFFKTEKKYEVNRKTQTETMDDGCLITINNIIKKPINLPILLIPRYENYKIIQASKIFNDEEICYYLKNPVTDFENEKFNNFFKVICSDEQYAYQILTLDLIDRIVTFKQKYKRKIKISYIENQMYIYLGKINYFEINHSNKNGFTLNKKKVLEFHRILMDLFEIIEQLCPDNEGGY